MKRFTVVIISIFLLSVMTLFSQQKFHIWAYSTDDDYSWTNDLVKELKNSKNNILIGNYQNLGDYTGIIDDDYIILINMSKDDDDAYGSIVLMHYIISNNKYYRNHITDIWYKYSVFKKANWLNTIRNILIDWIDEYAD